MTRSNPQLIPDDDSERTLTTPNERALKAAKNKKWEDLLAYHLQLYGLGKFFRREFVCPPEFGRKFRYDFGDPINRVLLEVNGGIWIPTGKSAHTGGVAIMRDQEKLNVAQFHGWSLFQFNDKTIKSLMAIELVRDFYARRGIVQKASLEPPF